MSGEYLLRREDVFSIEFAFEESARSIIAQSSHLDNFPFTKQTLVKMGGKACLGEFKSLEEFQIQLMCSPEWPLLLEFAETDATQQLNPSKRQRRQADCLIWDFDTVLELPNDKFTTKDLAKLEADGRIDKSLMPHLLASIFSRGHARMVGWKVAIWNETQNVVESEVDNVLVLYTERNGRWNLCARLLQTNNTATATTTTTLLRITNAKKIRNDHAFRSITAHLRAAATTTIRTLGKWEASASFDVLALLIWLLTRESIPKLKEIKEHVEEEEGETMRESVKTQVFKSLRAVLDGSSSDSAPLPPLPMPFPPPTASYKELWELFRRCGELDFVKSFLRKVPNGVNMRVHFTRDKDVPVSARRQFVWDKCEAYLRERFKF